MKNQKLENIISFSNSDPSSISEDEFMSNELQGYFDERQKRRYTQKLESEFDFRKKDVESDTVREKSTLRLRYFFLVLVAILIAFALYHVITSKNLPQSNTVIAFKNELYMPIDANIRGSISEDQRLLNQLAQAYEDRAFSSVITVYQQLKSNNAPFDLNVEQMAGIAYGTMGDYEAAINTFKGILNTKESTYSNHPTVRYLLGLIYMLQDDKVSAREFFSRVRVGEFKYDEAQRMLNNIDKSLED